MRVYLAGPLFGFAEREFNARFAALLTATAPEIEVLLPQAKAQELPKDDEFTKRMFEWCLRTIESSDAVLAVVDGADADSGTCIECGYAYAKGKPIVGVRTDLRSSEVKGVNLMVAGICARLIHEIDLETDLSNIVRATADALRNLSQT